MGHPLGDLASVPECCHVQEHTQATPAGDPITGGRSIRADKRNKSLSLKTPFPINVYVVYVVPLLSINKIYE